LERRDKIAEAVSALRSMTVEMWHQRAGSPPPDRVHVQIDHLIAVLSLNALNAAWWTWAASGLPVHSVFYEDDLSSSERLAGTVAEIAAVAGLVPRPGTTIEPALVRTSVGGWRDGVTNAGEIEAALGRSDLRHLLDP
jgi:LPS sulfotransferase NodH